MEAKEHVLKEYDKWTVEYEKAREDFYKLLPPAGNVSEGEQMGRIDITEELLAKYDEAVRRMNDALDKKGQVLRKLREHGGH